MSTDGGLQRRRRKRNVYKENEIGLEDEHLLNTNLQYFVLYLQFDQ